MDTTLDLRPTKPTLPILTGRRMWRMGATSRMARFVIFRVNTAGRYQADRSAMTLIGAKLKARMRPSIYGVDSRFALVVDQRCYNRTVRVHALDLMNPDDYERVSKR